MSDGSAWFSMRKVSPERDAVLDGAVGSLEVLPEIADAVGDRIEIHVGGHRVVSMMTAEAVDDLGLEIGDVAVAVVKATNVIIEIPRSAPGNS